MTLPLSENGGLMLAPLVGVGFGWFLERGGLGNAPLLAAQFYLRDLRVFKVMFSALLTAMLGLFWLDRFGVIQLSAVAMPPTFLLAQAVGGILFGFGFVIAGLCPGTSCVSAASGRMDGLAAVLGITAGVALFDLGLPWMMPLYQSTPMSNRTIAEAFGMPRGFVIGVITLLALAGFATAERIEKRAA